MFNKVIDENNHIDAVQKIAWRLVRSAEDRFYWAGIDKLKWCITRMETMYPKEHAEYLEDAIRAAFVNFRIETGQARSPKNK